MAAGWTDAEFILESDCASVLEKINGERDRSVLARDYSGY